MIVEINQPGTAVMFKHMNKAVVDKYKRQSIIPDLNKHKNRFEQTYNVRVIVKNSRWQSLEFSSEQDYLMSMLRFG